MTSESEEEHVRGAKMQPLTLVDRIGQRLCPLPIFVLSFQQSRERLRLFPEQTEGGQATAVRKGCERGNKRKIEGYCSYLLKYLYLSGRK